MLRATTLRPPKRNRFCSTGDCSDGDEGQEGQKREREEHEKLMKVGDEGVPRTRGPAFSRLAFIQAYRERQQNPTLAAQPGSSATSIRLGGAQQQQQQQQQAHQAAAVHAAAIPAVANAQQAHAMRDSPRHSRAASPAVSVTSGRPHKKPKALDGTMSDSGSGISATVINTAAQQKKAAKLAAGAAGAVGVAAAAPGTPASAPPESQQAALERTEREKAALEKKRLQQQQKRAQAQRRKERKKLELEKAQQAGDLQVGTPGSSVAGTPNWQS